MTDASTNRLTLQFNTLSETLSAMAILIGSAVLVGWLFDNHFLKSLHPGLVSMKPNAAAAFILAGTALWLTRTENVEPRKRRIAQLCASAVIVLGGLTLVEYVTGWNLGIDELLFRESSGTVWTSHPGRMAPSDALNFVLVGFALLDLDSPRAHWRVEILTLSVIFVSLGAYLAHLYALELLHGTGYYTHMAFHSTAAFCLLSVGILSSRTDRGLMAIIASDTAGGAMARRLLPATIVVPALLAWLLGQRAGYYETVFGLALITLANMAAFTVLILRSAGSLYGVDVVRKRAEEALRRNLTERRRIEEQLQDANVELTKREHVLQETLANLTQTHEALRSAQLQVIQTEKMESVGRLAAGVAHEVKNPLATILSGIDYLADRVNGGAFTGEVLREMEVAVKRANRIIGGLLDYSAPRDLELGFEDLNAVAEQALLLVKHELARVHVNVVRELAGDLPPVKVDKRKFEQVFINVFLNSIQAMTDGGTLIVRTYLRPEGETGFHVGSRRSKLVKGSGPLAVMEIEDTGTGIPEDQLRKVFEPFFTTKPTRKGTGLGLTVSRAIVEMHGGMMSIQNRENGGVQVRILLSPKGDRHEPQEAADDHR